ncbi:hypothetical protein AOLI_G00251520, partial [Acnodon oligacanthus]
MMMMRANATRETSSLFSPAMSSSVHSGRLGTGQ